MKKSKEPKGFENPHGSESGSLTEETIPQDPEPQPAITMGEFAITDLHPHPRQGAQFSDLSPQELAALADDMRRNGLHHFVEIRPDGTIICGHQRVRAARSLGWTSITCWVRDDLEAAGEEAIERRLIEDNLNRRQLSELEQARCYRSLREIAEHEEFLASDDNDQLLGLGKKKKRGDTRDVLAQRFGKSGRTMDRWDRVLDTPIEVQAACEQDRITLTLAAKVAGLRPADQAAIAQRIREGEEPKAVIAEFVQPKTAKTANVGKALGCLTRALDQACRDLQGRTDRVPYSESDYEVLERSQPLIRQLLSSMAANRDRFQRLLAACQSHEPR